MGEYPPTPGSRHQRTGAHRHRRARTCTPAPARPRRRPREPGAGRGGAHKPAAGGRERGRGRGAGDGAAPPAPPAPRPAPHAAHAARGQATWRADSRRTRIAAHGRAAPVKFTFEHWDLLARGGRALVGAAARHREHLGRVLPPQLAGRGPCGAVVARRRRLVARRARARARLLVARAVAERPVAAQLVAQRRRPRPASDVRVALHRRQLCAPRAVTHLPVSPDRWGGGYSLQASVIKPWPCQLYWCFLVQAVHQFLMTCTVTDRTSPIGVQVLYFNYSVLVTPPPVQSTGIVFFPSF